MWRIYTIIEIISSFQIQIDICFVQREIDFSQKISNLHFHKGVTIFNEIIYHIVKNWPLFEQQKNVENLVVA